MTGASGTFVDSWFNGLDSKWAGLGGGRVKKSNLLANRFVPLRGKHDCARLHFSVFATQIKISGPGHRRLGDTRGAGRAFHCCVKTVPE